MTTTTILADLASATVNQDVLEEVVTIDSTSNKLLKVDFISSRGSESGKGMIYNFLNQRADPGELEFEAYLFRSSFNIGKEEKILFGYLDDLAGDLRACQLQFRMRTLAKSICDYEIKYGRVLKIQIQDYLNDNQNEINDLKHVLEGGTFLEAKRSALIEIRAAFETALFQYFEKRFTYLYCFWNTIASRSISSTISSKEKLRKSILSLNAKMPTPLRTESNSLSSLKASRRCSKTC